MNNACQSPLQSNFSFVYALSSNNSMRVHHFVVDGRTLFPYKVMCDRRSEMRSMTKERIEGL